MNYLDLTLPTPAENLAADEALAVDCDAGGPEVLRFWEARAVFVVTGYANRLGLEVELAACQAEGVPVFRRISGGGAVLQMPGCLNYALVLRTPAEGPLAAVVEANRLIMERNARAISSVSGEKVEVKGHTDLAIAGRKFSGNSQRRLRTCFLFHGSLLMDARLELISRYLRFPSKPPDYRQDREHEQFVRNLGGSVEEIKTALRRVWEAEAPLSQVPLARIRQLAAEKYGQKEWNEKFG